MTQQPPNVNGVMDLSEAEITAIRAELVAIRDAFTPTDDMPVVNTFYIVSTYNRQNAGSEINGDTAESLLK